MSQEKLDKVYVSVGPRHCPAGELNVLHSGIAIATGLWIEPDNVDYFWKQMELAMAEPIGSRKAKFFMEQALITLHYNCVADGTGYWQVVKRSPFDPEYK